MTRSLQGRAEHDTSGKGLGDGCVDGTAQPACSPPVAALSPPRSWRSHRAHVCMWVFGGCLAGERPGSAPSRLLRSKTLNKKPQSAPEAKPVLPIAVDTLYFSNCGNLSGMFVLFHLPHFQSDVTQRQGEELPVWGVVCSPAPWSVLLGGELGGCSGADASGNSLTRSCSPYGALCSLMGSLKSPRDAAICKK